MRTVIACGPGGQASLFAPTSAGEMVAVATFDGPADIQTVFLRGQLARIWRLMLDGRYRTLKEIAAATGDPEGSIGSQLRNLRLARNGGHETPKRRRNLGPAGGTGPWEYRLEPAVGFDVDLEP